MTELSFNESKETALLFAGQRFTQAADTAYQLYKTLRIGEITLPDFLSIHNTDEHIRQRLWESDQMQPFRNAPVYEADVKAQIKLPVNSVAFHQAYEAISPNNARSTEIIDFLTVKNGHIILQESFYKLAKERATTFISKGKEPLYKKITAIEKQLQQLQKDYPEVQLLPQANPARAELLSQSADGSITLNTLQLIDK